MSLNSHLLVSTEPDNKEAEVGEILHRWLRKNQN